MLISSVHSIVTLPDERTCAFPKVLAGGKCQQPSTTCVYPKVWAFGKCRSIRITMNKDDQENNQKNLQDYKLQPAVQSGV